MTLQTPKPYLTLPSPSKARFEHLKAFFCMQQSCQHTSAPSLLMQERRQHTSAPSLLMQQSCQLSNLCNNNANLRGISLAYTKTTPTLRQPYCLCKNDAKASATLLLMQQSCHVSWYSSCIQKAGTALAYKKLAQLLHPHHR